MQFAQIKQLKVSRFILGSNPFSGFSHQGSDADWEMRHFFSTTKIKETLFEAEGLGINTVIARTDFHIMRMLMEYRDEGGQLQWFAQTCPEVGDHATCIMRAHTYGARACHIHGGVMDNLYFSGKLDEIPPAIEMIRQKGMLAGVAAHDYRVIEWAAEHLDVDYFMCCYYNPQPRDVHADHDPNAAEIYQESDRRSMTDLIQRLSRPVIHYKIMAAGRNDPREAFAFAASKMRPNDAVCVGIYQKDAPGILQQDVELLEEYLKEPAR
jgi:hypothetical protein